MKFAKVACEIFQVTVSTALTFACAAFLSLAVSERPSEAGEVIYKCDGLEEKSSMTSIAVKMYQGYDGWFFREGDMNSLYELSPGAISAFKRVNDALAFKGVHLILMPMLPRGLGGKNFIPDGGVLSDMVYDPNFSATQFRAMISSLRDRGIDTIDITAIQDAHPEFDWSTFYLKRDIHWTPEGARLVAGAVAEHIRKLRPEDVNSLEFRTVHTNVKSTIHTLMATALNEICQDKIPAEHIDLYETKRLVDSLDALLSDDEADSRDFVHVVGTSFTDEKMDFNFNGFLRESLKRDVAGFSIAGGGLTQSVYAWTQNAVGLSKRPEFLIWEYADLKAILEDNTYINSGVVPAIIGDCAADLEITAVEFGNDNKIDIDFPSITGKAADYYLRFQLSNNALTGFQLNYKYADGATKIMTFANPSRVSGLVQLYQALPDTGPHNPVHVRLKIDGNATSAGSVKLCRYPQGVFQDTANSN
ncbi:UNVERIFIED_ORG: hypothetical protein GGD59_003275 [Rhizobium esperanzae]